jgi:hypothetical protein
VLAIINVIFFLLIAGVSGTHTFPMKAAVFAVAACLLVGSAFATLGDNGMTTYNGRTRQNDTLVFGNQLIIDNAMAATFDIAEQMLTGTYQAYKNDPATEKEVVSLIRMHF